LSSDTKGSVTPYLVDRKLNLSQLSTSKIDSPLSQILHATHSPQRSKDTSSFVKDKSSTQQPQYFTPRTGAHSLNSFRHESSLNESHSFVHVKLS